MHLVFRIGIVQQIEENDRLWQMNLTLTGDNDPQLQFLMKSMTDQTTNTNEWFRLGQLMIQLARLDKTKQVYDIVFTQTADEKRRGSIYYQLGNIEHHQGKFWLLLTTTSQKCITIWVSI